MLEFAILGFLYESRLHGYELRKRLAALTGHLRPIADGTLYPAIKRLVDDHLVVKELEPGEAAPRHMLMITADGGERLMRMLREPADVYFTDENHWFCLLAFLRHLDDPAAQAAILRRRLDFLSTPSSFFYENGRALSAEDVDDVWVELFVGVPAWLGDDLVRIADRDGSRCLVVGEAAVTPPQVYIRSVVAVEESSVVVSASLGDPTQVSVLRWSPDGLEQLTPDEGVHSAVAADGVVVISSTSLASSCRCVT